MTYSQTPFSNLDPDLILNSIDALGFQTSGHLLALNSYENRVYQIGIEDEKPIIAKFYRPHRWSDAAIREEHDFSQNLHDLDIPVVPPTRMNGTTLHTYQDYRYAVFKRVGGRSFEAGDLTQLEWIGRFIGRIHALGTSLIFKERMTLNTDTYGRAPIAFLWENDFIPAYLAPKFKTLFEELFLRLDEKFAATPIRPIALHGDLHPGNILWTDAGPHIVDLDDCLMGPAMQDLWMLLSSTDPSTQKIEINEILTGYESFCDFNYAELRLIEPLRTLRMLHYMGWLAKRWNDPAFPLNFTFFNTPNYWEQQYHHLLEQLAILQND